MNRVLGLAGVLVLIGGWGVEAQMPDWRSTAEITLTEPQTAVKPQTATPQTAVTRVIVRPKSRRVYVYEGKVIIASYAIAVGKSGWETPPGEYQVFSKEENPIFKNFKTGNIIKPGRDNPLGVRWIGFWTDGKTQLGFHGTNQPELIGQAVSHGCIRMRNKDVTALFEKVAIGTPVIVEP
jgi:lipoprotein-anchoring transpeptidase ErfK/SrfK